MRAMCASSPSVIPPASEKFLGVCDFSLIRKGWEDLLETNHRIRDSCCQEQKYRSFSGKLQ